MKNPMTWGCLRKDINHNVKGKEEGVQELKDLITQYNQLYQGTGKIGDKINEEIFCQFHTTVFRDSKARATIACQMSVLVACAKLMQVTLRRKENPFSTLVHDAIVSNSIQTCV